MKGGNRQSLWIILLLCIMVSTGFRLGAMIFGGLAVATVSLASIRSYRHMSRYRPIRQPKLLTIAGILLVLLCYSLYILVFRVLAESQGYRPPALPLQILKQQTQASHSSSSSNGNDNLLTVFLIDGLRADILEQELEAGNLPAIQRLAENGCRIRNVMATFPSITGYAYWPLLTGIDATRSGHLGTRYFDRRVNVGNWKNHYGPAGVNFEPGFDRSVPTLFEASALLDPDSWTLAGNSMLKRGANVTYVASLEQYFSKLMHKWWLPKLLRRIPILKWLAPDFFEFERRFLRRILKILEQGKPRVVWTVFPSIDNVAHALGVHEEYPLVLRAIDEAIGNYVEAVHSSKKYKSYSFAVISDHGEASVDIPAGGNLDLCEAFLAQGVRAWRGNAKAWSGKFDEQLGSFGIDKDVLIGIQGDASGSVYVKSSNGWLDRTYEDELRSYKVAGQQDVDLIHTALKFRGIELVAWSRKNGVVCVQTNLFENDGDDHTNVSGVGVIRLHADGRVSYGLEGHNRCPLGYGPTLADGVPRSAREWLDLTQTTAFPYAIVRLLQCLTVPGLAPDMIVTTQEGFDLSKDWEYFILNFAGGHGGINPTHLRTPAIFSGDGVVSSGQILGTATAEDVGASLHKLLGAIGPGELPSLNFLESRMAGDVIAEAYWMGSNNGTSGSYAQELLQGTPLSCITGGGD